MTPDNPELTPDNRQPAAVRSVAIVGGGIAGLSAAFLLRSAGLRVTVLEGSPRLGGKLAVSEVGGIEVDSGAEALLARREEGVGLIAELGLSDDLQRPGTTSAGIWTRGAVRPLPRRQYLGVPADLAELAATGLLSPEGLARARQDAEPAAAGDESGTAPETADGEDSSVTERVGGRLGQELVDRLVEPLLGGVYAGRCEDLSFQATLPSLARAAPRFRSLSEAAASLLPPVPPAPPAPPPPGPPPPGNDMDVTLLSQERQQRHTHAASGRAEPPASASEPAPGNGRDEPQQAPPPVFTTLAGGLGSLPPKLAAASGAVIRTRATVRELTRLPRGWRLTIGSAHDPEWLEADAVILALPARPASRLLAGVDGAAPAAAALAEISYASMAIVTLAYPGEAFPVAPSGSGFLVPAVDGHAIKAVTFSTVKWPHLRRAPGQDGPRQDGPRQDEPRQDTAGLHIVRCSVGRFGDEAILQRDDADLADVAAADLATATGVRGQPADSRVTRWGGGLPQYSVGHLGRVARIRAGVATQPGLAVCGAAYDGIGIPACIASARLAVSQVLAHLRTGHTAGS
jgi:protoporphyrinogen oxidase